MSTITVDVTRDARFREFIAEDVQFTFGATNLPKPPELTNGLIPTVGARNRLPNARIKRSRVFDEPVNID